MLTLLLTVIDLKNNPSFWVISLENKSYLILFFLKYLFQPKNFSKSSMFAGSCLKMFSNKTPRVRIVTKSFNKFEHFSTGEEEM